MKKRTLLAVVLTVTLLANACSNSSAPSSGQISSSPTAAPTAVASPSPQKKSNSYKTIKQLSTDVMGAFIAKDMKELSQYVHPEMGLRFSMCGYVDMDNDLVFDKEQLAGLFSDSTQYLWGPNDENGKPIKSSAKDYFDTHIYKNYDRFSEGITLTASSSSVSNEFEAYPDAVAVEHIIANDNHFTSEGTMLHLIYLKQNGEYYLAGIIVIDMEP